MLVTTIQTMRPNRNARSAKMPSLPVVTALLRNVYTVQTWLRMREEFGIPGTESGPILAWAFQTLVEGIRAGTFPRGELGDQPDCRHGRQ